MDSEVSSTLYLHNYDAKIFLYQTVSLPFFFFSFVHTLLYICLYHNAYIGLRECQYALVSGLQCSWGLTFGIYDLVTLKGQILKTAQNT